MRTALFLLASMLLASSCAQNEFGSLLFRTTEDPFPDTPEADSLSLERTVYLSWQEDDAADTFRLMRSPDKETLSFSCIYEGKETSHTDTDLADGGKYIYRLDKTRGRMLFEGKRAAFGWSSGCRNDECEPNNTEETAAFLEHDRICSLPCIGFITGGAEIIDEDWFYAVIPPMRQADIVIGQQGLENSAAGAETNLRIQLKGLESQPVKHLKAYSIKNPGYETRRFYFKIFPERTSLAPGGSFLTTIEYTVSLNQIIKY